MKKIKLLFAYSEMVLGGSTTSLISLLSELDKERYDIDLILYKNRGEMLPYIPEGVNLLPEAYIYGQYNRKLLKIFRTLFSGMLFKSYAKNIKYKKKFSSSGQVDADTQVMLFSRSINKKYDIAIGYIEGWADKYIASPQIVAKKKIGWLHVDYGKSYFVSELDMASMCLLDRIIDVSDECLENNRKIFQEVKHCYLPNLLSTNVIRRRALEKLGETKFEDWINEKKIKIITVCRLDNDHKGIDRAVNAAKYLVKNKVSFKWIVIGDGRDKAVIQSEIEANGLQNEFELLGSRVNPLPYVKYADLFVLPSRYEGKPMVITEAMMLGVPVLVTKYASADEQIKNGVDGIVVPNEDDALNVPLLQLLSDSKRIEQLKMNVSKTEYGNLKDVEMYYSLFEDLLNE